MGRIKTTLIKRVALKLYELYKDNKLTNKEIEFVKNKLTKSLKLSESRLTEEGFEINYDKETWMDTSADGIDTRPGVRIEIQALRLAMYNFAYELTEKSSYKNKDHPYEKLQNK